MTGQSKARHRHGRVGGRIVVTMGLLAVATLGTAVVAPSVGAGVPPWRIVASPNPSADSNYLQGVSCVSPTACTAVGYSQSPNQTTLVESWNGSHWSIVPSPNVTTQPVSLLSGVSCVGTTWCVAVGWSENLDGSGDETLIESWDGSTWTIVPSPDPVAGTASSLWNVSCLTTTDCTAVGAASFGTLIESWDGSTWTIVPSPNPIGSNSGQLQGVSCVSAADCTAVGTSSLGTLVEAWDGESWTVVASPNPGGNPNSYFEDVSCATTTSCMAVGYYSQGTGGQTLAEAWDGSSWSIVPSGGVDGVLFGISCLATDNCTATGWAYEGTDRTLAEDWDGSSWSVVASPNQGGFTVISGVSCTTSSCTTVGWDQTPGTSRTLIESESLLHITTTSLPAGTVGVPYSFTLQAAGGNPPYKWGEYGGGRLPRGLSFSSAGVISGTPKKAGVTSVTFRVRDTKSGFYQPYDAASAYLTFTITID